MHKLKQESGRTMLEMIGVLIIIGLLTVGSLTGYSYLVQRHRRQEVAREAAQLVMGIKTSGAARKYGDGAVIPARDFVSGVGVRENPHVLKFADGEHSYAVVTQLANGAFALNLQLEPGTCHAVLDTLGTEDAVIFKPAVGEIKNAHQMEEESKRWLQATNRGSVEEGKKFKAAKEDHKNKEKDARLGVDIIEYCDNGGYVSWAEGCAPGDAAYGNIVSTTCHGCEAGNLLDINGKCCPVSANNCGTKYCECPAGTMCNQETSECVECSTFGSQEKGNAQCKNVYNKFSKHVCRSATNSCVECLTSGDCSPTTGYSDSALYAGKEFHYCSDYKCVECNMDYNGKDADEGRKEFPCPTQTKPLCNQGTCEPCPEDQVWDDNKKECVCTNGKIKTANGTCALCVDNKTNYGLDSGCEQDTTKPMCTDDAVSTSYATGGTMKEGTQCVECITDKNCEHNTDKKYCSKEYTCIKCDGVWDSENRECRECQDGYSGDAKDDGCDRGPEWIGKKLCKPENNPTGNGTQAYGDACYKCQNNNYGEHRYAQDNGCEPTIKICAAGEDEYGNACYKCEDDQPNSGNINEVSADSGCDARELPLCKAVEGKYGTECFKCLNDKDGYGVDFGCPDKAPMCGGKSTKDGEYYNECGACAAGTVWNATEGKCVTCYDDKTEANTDTGCGGEGTWKDKPICDAGENTGGQKSGDACAVCVDDKTLGTIDSGCGGEGTWKDKPICDVGENTGSNKPGESCGVCIDDNADAGLDSGCGADQWTDKPICDVGESTGKNKIGDSCVRCINDKTGYAQDSGCIDATKPMCNGAENGGAGTACVGCPEGQVWSSTEEKCVTPCSGCIGRNGECVKLEDYDDIKRGANGACECLASVRTQTINDIQSFDYGKIERDTEYNCKRLQSYRQRKYSIPVRFYCPRYMHVSKNMEADDFVPKSYPEGIGKSSPAVLDKTWVYAHTNTIKPKVSDKGKTIVGKDTAWMIVQDRWLGEVGLSKGGYFYFTVKRGDTADEVKPVHKLTVTAGWAKGSSKKGPVGGYVCKKGAGSSKLPSKYKKKCDNYCHNFTGPY